MKVFGLEVIDKLDNINHYGSLNDKQNIAANAVEGNYLVLAGPGSGKTHTLIYRIDHMINVAGKRPSEIAVITFTNKAANELKQRLKKQGIFNIGFVGTFHSFCLRKYLKGDFAIIEPSDESNILSKIIKERGSLEKVFYKRYSITTLKKQILKTLSFSMNTLTNLRDNFGKNKDLDLQSEQEIDECMSIVGEYTKFKNEHNYINFDDVLVKVLQTDLSDLHKNEINYLMLDEYQDTNKLQLEIVKKINFKNFMGIGDEMQSIYKFRGARIENVFEFSTFFDNAKLITLTTNYRSNHNVVELVNQINKGNNKFYNEKQLTSFNDEYVKLKYNPTYKRDKYMLKQIQNLKENETFALLYRTNRERYTFEKTLTKNKIDYVVYGGFKLFERAHVKDIISCLWTYLDSNYVVHFQRSLKLIPKIGDKSADKIIALWNESHIVENKTNELLGEFFDLLGQKKSNYEDVVKGFIKWYSKVLLEKLAKDSNEYQDKLEDIKIFASFCKDFESLEVFLQELTLEYAKDTEQEGKVILSTIHSSKGLEFDNVVLLSENLCHEEEDARLLYVAVSRAKTNLTIFDPRYSSLNEMLSHFNSYLDKEYFEQNEDEVDSKLVDDTKQRELNLMKNEISNISNQFKQKKNKKDLIKSLKDLLAK